MFHPSGAVVVRIVENARRTSESTPVRTWRGERSGAVYDHEDQGKQDAQAEANEKDDENPEYDGGAAAPYGLCFSFISAPCRRSSGRVGQVLLAHRLNGAPGFWSRARRERYAGPR